MKKFMTAIVVTTMLLTTGGNVLALDSKAPSPVDVIATNKKLNFNFQYEGVRVGKPFIENNRTFIPLRVVSEDLGYEVDWNQESQTAIVSKGSNEVKIKIGDNFALVNGVKTYIDIQDGKPVDTKAQLKDSRTYVPVRFISEAMGDKVDYRMPSTSSVKNMTIYINSSNLPVESAPVSTTLSNGKPPASIPVGAKFISKDPNFDIWTYSYEVNLSGNAKIEKVLVSKRWKNVQVSVIGIDISGNSFMGTYSKNTGLSFLWSMPELTHKDQDVIITEAKKFMN